MIVTSTLAIVLYGQARHLAREIRRNRSNCTSNFPEMLVAPDR